MKAPPELVTQFQRALETALARLRKNPDVKPDSVAEIVAKPQLAARIIAAALLPTGAVYGRAFDHSTSEMQERILYYEDSVTPPARMAIELLRYEEVETYIEQNPTDDTVSKLLGSQIAKENLSARLLRRLVLSNPQNVCLEIGGRRLTFLVRDGDMDRGVTLIFDDKGYMSGVAPKPLSSAGEGPRYVMFREPRPLEKNSKVVVLDLQKGLYCEPEDAWRTSYEPGSRVVELCDSGVVFERVSGERFCTPFSAFKYLRPLPFY